MDSVPLERKRALARERQRRRRANAAVRAKESAAKRQRREANPELRKKATEAKRRQRQANPELHRQKATEAQRRRRQANPELIRKDTEARRLRRQANPELRKKAAQAKRQLRKGNPELRKKETQDKRTWRQANAASSNQEAEQSLKRREVPLIGGTDGHFKRDVYHPALKCSRLLEPSPAAEHASSVTLVSHLPGKGNSLTQCGVSVVFKSSQADFKPKSRSVGVQTQQGRKIPAGVAQRISAATGMAAVRRSRPKVADLALRLWEELQSRNSATALDSGDALSSHGQITFEELL